MKLLSKGIDMVYRGLVALVAVMLVLGLLGAIGMATATPVMAADAEMAQVEERELNGGGPAQDPATGRWFIKLVTGTVFWYDSYPKAMAAYYYWKAAGMINSGTMLLVAPTVNQYTLEPWQYTTTTPRVKN